VQPVDPDDIASRFSTERALWANVCFRDPPDIGRREYIKKLLARIPPSEADYIRLYYLHGKKQEDIAKIFGRTQADISYRLIKGIERIKFLMTIPIKVDAPMIRDELDCLLARNSTQPELDMKVMVGIYKTTCQSYVAKQCGITQGKVRHRFFRTLKLIAEILEDVSTPNLLDVYKVFHAISDKRFNILKEISYPQFFVAHRIIG